MTRIASGPKSALDTVELKAAMQNARSVGVEPAKIELMRVTLEKTEAEREGMIIALKSFSKVEDKQLDVSEIKKSIQQAKDIGCTDVDPSVG